MHPEFTDETLMAFADGALDEPQFSQVAEAVEADEALAARLETLVTGSTLARKGFEHLLAPVPPALEADVRARIRASRRKPFWQGDWSRWLFPSASLAAAAIAIVVAIPTLGQWLTSPDATPFGELSGREVAALLDTLPSGQSHTLASGTVIHTVATFTDANGALCREFETEGGQSYVAVSCRTNSDWTVQLALANAADGNSYRPASGLEALDSFLAQIGAGAPLALADEETALRELAD